MTLAYEGEGCRALCFGSWLSPLALPQRRWPVGLYLSGSGGCGQKQTSSHSQDTHFSPHSNWPGIRSPGLGFSGTGAMFWVWGNKTVKQVFTVLVTAEDMQNTGQVLCDLCLPSLSNNMTQLRKQVTLSPTCANRIEVGMWSSISRTGFPSAVS